MKHSRFLLVFGLAVNAGGIRIGAYFLHLFARTPGRIPISGFSVCTIFYGLSYDRYILLSSSISLVKSHILVSPTLPMYTTAQCNLEHICNIRLDGFGYCSVEQL